MINIIVAMDKNRLIGANNSIPWSLPDDLGFFKTMTVDKVVVMGRKTFESLGSKPLPGRINVVMTTKSERLEPSIIQTDKIDLVMQMASTKEIFIIGGTQVYEQFMKHADRLYISHVDGNYTGDTYFPMYDTNVFKQVSSWKRNQNGIDFQTTVYSRK